MTNLSLDELVKGAELRKQCGIPIDETPVMTVICTEEAVGEIQLPIENGLSSYYIDMPICQGHLEDIRNNWKKKLDNA